MGGRGPPVVAALGRKSAAAAPSHKHVDALLFDARPDSGQQVLPGGKAGAQGGGHALHCTGLGFG